VKIQRQSVSRLGSSHLLKKA